MATARLLHEKVGYRSRLGVTEAGTPTMGLAGSPPSASAAFLREGIGDTMRVSPTADPVEGGHSCRQAHLQACGIRRAGGVNSFPARPAARRTT